MIQKKGDFECSSKYQPIGVRRSIKHSVSEKIPCPFCNGYFNKNNLRNHVRLHCNNRKSEKTNLQVLSKSLLPDLHSKACLVLGQKIFPSLRADQIVKAVSHVELVIIFAKYSTSDHHHKMIRYKIRHIERILIGMRRINANISDVSSIFLNPSSFESFVEAVHNLAGLSEGKFKSTCFGPTSVTLFSQLGEVLQCETIKRKNDE